MAAAVALSALASLASSGSAIVLQKDWVVVVADKDADRLASELKKIAF